MPARKRAAEEVTAAEPGSSARRRSGRLSSTTAAKKSSYWEGSDNEDKSEGDEDEKPLKKKARLSNGKRVSAAKKKVEEDDEDEYTVEAQLADEAGDDNDDDDDDVDEEEVVEEKKKEKGKGKETDQPKGKGKGKKEKKAAADDDDDEEDKPLKVEILPLEKMRPEGPVAYEDFKVHKNTMLFLADLKANNKRPWLKSHDGEFRRALKDWQTFVDQASQTVSEADETVPELPSKDVVFRIYRDTRFSKDPTPYKPHFSAAWSRTGRKGPYACYYIHCEPGGSSFVGGGLWYPEAPHVQKLRRSIDRHPERWREVFDDADFRRVFFPQVEASADVEAVIKAFVGKNQVNALKKKPMGYDATHQDIELLKLKNYTVGVPFDETILTEDDAQEKVGEYIRAMEKFITFVNSVVMPDPGDESDSDDDDDEDEEQNDD